MTTAVETATSKLGKLLVDKDTKWDAIAAALLAVREEALGKIELPTPEKSDKVPVPVRLSVMERSTLMMLESVLDAVDWPTERAELTDDQGRQLLKALTVQKVLDKLAKRILANVKLPIFNSFDVRAENAGLVNEDTPQDKWGHYALEDELADADSGTKVVRQVSAPKPYLDEEALRAAETRGVISHQEYLDMTVGERVFSEDKAMSKLARDRTLGDRLAPFIKMTPATNSLVPKQNGQ